MRRRSGNGALLWRSLAVLLLLALVGAAAVFAADRTDRSFGEEGVSQVPLRQELPLVISDLAIAPDGKLLASMTDFKAIGYFGALRLFGNGAVDTSFGDAGFTEALEVPRRVVEPQAQAIAAQPDGKAMVAGFQGWEGGFAPLLARYRGDGSLDRSFGHGGLVAPRPRVEGGDVFHGVALQPDGRIIAVGARNEVAGGKPAGLVVAYRPDGRLDRSFGRDGRVVFPFRRVGIDYTGLWGVAVSRAGKIVVAGYRNNRLMVARLTQNGQPDPSFSGDGVATVGIGANGCCAVRERAAIALQRDGRIVVLGNGGGLAFRVVIARFLPDGRLDRHFGGDGLVSPPIAKRIEIGYDVTVDRAGRIVVVGNGDDPGNSQGFSFNALRFRPDGRIDRNFGRSGLQTLPLGRSSYAQAVVTQSSGRVVAGGGVEVGRGASTSWSLLLTRYH
jgi:uncharacterized delta-60 repeat protein